VLAWRLVLVLVLDAAKERTYIATDTRIDSIVWGCILAIVANPVLDRIPFSRRTWNAVLFPLGLALIAASYAIRAPQFEETVRYTLQGIGLVPLFVVAIREHDRGVFRVLNWRPVAFLGAISYSVYLLHPTVLFTIADSTHWHPVVQGALGLVITLAIALVLYVAVERPCARLRKRLSRVDRAGAARREASPGTEPVPPSLAPARR
jgi:peptidoglycan/LPS O-acetylase OafA/YrhL